MLELQQQTANSAYLDLTSQSVALLKTINLEMDCEVLFLDNAQHFLSNYPGIGFKLNDVKYLVAAFSPGATTYGSFDAFKKSCGDDKHTIVYFRPLDEDESKKFLEVAKNVIVSDEEEGEKYISSEKFKEYFFLSNGAPRYMKKLIKGDRTFVSNEICVQHEQAFSSKSLNAVELSANELQSILYS